MGERDARFPKPRYLLPSGESVQISDQLPNHHLIEQRLDTAIERLRNRKDVKSLDVFWYPEVVKEPEKHFRILKEHGWSLDVEKASSVVDPKYYRFRREKLTVGVL